MQFLIETINSNDDITTAALFNHMHMLALVPALENEQKTRSGGSVEGRRPNIDRDFRNGHLRIMMDYFWPSNDMRPDGSLMVGPVYNDEHFRRRFCISKAVFYKVFSKVVADNQFFQKGLRPNCAGKIGLTPLQKVVSAIRQLCYGFSADAVDEYVRIGESTALLSLKQFCRSVVLKFESSFLSLPSKEDLQRMENQFAAVGFPGCIGCLDCSGWQWDTCPRGLQGIMCGKEKKPHVKMEVICDLDLYIWHFYFGLPGMLNDIDIMWISPLMNAFKVGSFPSHEVRYEINGEKFNWYYLLTDGIYPQNYKIFQSSIPNATSNKEKLFCRMQEGARKCVERVFGVLFKRFGILNVPGRLWCDREMGYIIKACVVLHNMCVVERRSMFVGDGVGGGRDERIERELSGTHTTLETRDREEMIETLSGTASDIYDDIDESERLTRALMDNLNDMYN